MTTQTFLKLAALSLCTLVASGCSLEDDADLDTPGDALLYDLSEAELDQIYIDYGGDDDSDEFRARLTAPFDCSLYGQFCEQVGRDAAYLITGEMIDLALDGAELDAIETHFDQRVEEAAAVDDDGDEDKDEFRAAGGWTTQTNGSYRLRVRNGVTSPLFGDRKAWTEAKMQKKTLGVWSNKTATQLCVNAGTNTQTEAGTIYFANWPFQQTQYAVIESSNPGNACTGSIKTKTISTDHDRRNAHSGQSTYWSYTIRAAGCATGSINSLNFSACASAYEKSF